MTAMPDDVAAIREAWEALKAHDPVDLLRPERVQALERAIGRAEAQASVATALAKR